MSSSLPDYALYSKDKFSDKEVMKGLWKLLDEADVVVAHNGIKFDRKKVNTRFIYHGMKPPSPYRMVDTLTQSRSNFSFTSNRLNDLGQFLGLGKKLQTGGFDLWKGCLNADMKSWRKMVRYCKQDVRLLERVYLKLLPYMKGHPNISVDRPACCPKCGSSKIILRGFAYTNTQTYQKFFCKGCGGWGRFRKAIKKGLAYVGL